MWEWVKSKKSGWTDFYNFLECSASSAKRMLTNHSINAALTAEGDKLKCSSCHKSHPGKCNKVKTSVVAQGAEKTVKTCPVCGGQPYKYKMKSGSEGISKRIMDC